MSVELPDIIDQIEGETQEKTDEPPMYRVIMHNDDYTPREFVVEILVAIFNKTHTEASDLMWHIHRKGRGVVGVYDFEIAEVKVARVIALAREFEFPLKATMEPDG